MKNARNIISNYLIFSYIVFFLLLLFYFFYKFLNKDSGSQLVYNYKLLIFLNLIIIFILGFILLKFNNLIKNILVIISILFFVSLYLFEYYIYLNHYSPVEHYLPKQIAKANGYIYDARPFTKIKEDELINNQEEIFFVTGVNKAYFEKNDFFHLAYGSFKKIYLGTEGMPGFFFSDRFGFRNNDKVWDNEPGVVEYATIGDGYSIGCCINQGTIADHIENISKKSTVNLGVSGSGPLKKLAILREYGKILKPKYVIWTFNDSNVHYTMDEISNPYLKKYLDRDFDYDLVNKQEKINKAFIEANNKRINDHNKSYLNRFIKLYGLRLFISNISSGKINLATSYYRYSNTKIRYSASQEKLTEYKKILTEVKSLVNSWGSELYFVYLPVYNEVLEINSLDNNFVLRKQIKDLVSSINIKFIDVYEEEIKFLNDKKIIFPLGLNFHYNSTGYEISAKEILKKIENDKNYN